ncbi:hypothetical protein GCM10011375_38560 [Hymenobacter qilianensis]|uniref:Uncharacterized protein n=2 Tax=Hymenobacter qilianensis TaxID=1385715 RepID=A0ACB5PWP7_9BACT|nr:hypothetical protein [Hymenobacter qilianensis]QNP54257.1 hypothetical protein H9L05_21535 [Hymenobacter qilianensis]GGF79786.1 hypothetical protein GCM10011375_38560 [Hymenobacter qilianensis]
MACSLFTPIPDELPAAERAARRKRQRHAEWGIAVARLGGTEPCRAIVQELQRYIDGEVSLQQLAGQDELPRPSARVLEATRQREEFSR